MKNLSLTNKPAGLYNKMLLRLKEAEESVSLTSKKSYIPFPVVFEKIGRTFSLKKTEIWEYLFLFRDFNFVEIVRFKGVRLRYGIKNK